MYKDNYTVETGGEGFTVSWYLKGIYISVFDNPDEYEFSYIREDGTVVEESGKLSDPDRLQDMILAFLEEWW